MIALKINDVKHFMSQLLVKETFDIMNLSEAIISIGNTFQISGEINREFYTDQELELLSNTAYSSWSSLKSICLGLIKGNKTPTYMKIVFLLPPTEVQKLIDMNQLDFSATDVNGLFLNIKYSENSLTIITGSSIRIFTLDKSLDTAFDKYCKQFLTLSNIDFDEI